MKIRKIIIAILLVLLAVSCKKVDVEGELSTGCNMVVLPGTGGSVSVSVFSTQSWMAKSDAEWISFENQVSKIIISIGQNPDCNVRSGCLSISSGGKKLDITVKQMAQSMLNIDQHEFTFSDEGGKFHVAVDVTSEYGMKISDEWIVEESLKNDDNDELSFIVLPNDGYDARVGSIVFEVAGKTEEVIVRQSAKGALFLGEKNIVIDEKNGQFSVELKSNVADCTCSFSEDCKWISLVEAKSLESRIYNFSVNANKNRKDRNATIFFESKSLDLKDTLYVCQTGKISIYRLYHSNDIIDIPLLTGENVVGTVDWGDQTEIYDYSIYLTHRYAVSDKQSCVTITSRNEQSIKIENLMGVSMVELP